MATGKYTRTAKHIEAFKRGAFKTNGSLTPEQRFWSKVQKSDGCWEWQGQRNHKGYGELSINSRWIKAHRYSWALVHGEIPARMQVCHRCDNRCCVNPDHLFVGTNGDNQVDAVRKGRNPIAQLNEQLVREIRTLAPTKTKAEIARTIGVSWSAVHRVITRECWKHVK